MANHLCLISCPWKPREIAINWLQLDSTFYTQRSKWRGWIFSPWHVSRVPNPQVAAVDCLLSQALVHYQPASWGGFPPLTFLGLLPDLDLLLVMGEMLSFEAEFSTEFCLKTRLLPWLKVDLKLEVSLKMPGITSSLLEGCRETPTGQVSQPENPTYQVLLLICVPSNVSL